MLNKLQLIGRLGQDPEMKTTSSGNTVTNFGVATSEKWKDKNTGEMQEKTEWHRVSVWGKQAENCNQYLTKGSMVFVEGKVSYSKVPDKDGVEHTYTQIEARDVKFLSPKGENNA